MENLRGNTQRRSPELTAVLVSVIRQPFSTLIEGFNWKTAAISAFLRANMFFLANLRAGSRLALRATLVEATYSICAMGVFGAITQRIRNARPAWLTGLTVWLAIPATLLTVQYFVHHAFGTPELRTSMAASFCFAALGTGFNWFAMRRGALLVGSRTPAQDVASTERRSFAADLRAMPAIIWAFVTAFPRVLADRG